MDFESILDSIQKNKVTYIILEGIDGIGKTWFAKELYSTLKDAFGNDIYIRLVSTPTKQQKEEYSIMKLLDYDDTPLLDIAMFTSYIDKNVFDTFLDIDIMSQRRKVFILDRWYLSTLAYQFTDKRIHKLSEREKESARMFVERRIDKFIDYIKNKNNGNCEKCILLYLLTPKDWNEYIDRLKDKEQRFGTKEPELSYLEQVDEAYFENIRLMEYIDYPEVKTIVEFI